jgi:hypothetical protein
MGRAWSAIPAILAALVAAVACGGDADSAPERSYTLGLRVDDSADRYRDVAVGEVDIRAADEVTFELDNTGSLVHDLQIVDPDGTTIATAEPVVPGEQTTVTARFDEPDYFRLDCLVDDHLTVHEMHTFFEVTEREV